MKEIKLTKGYVAIVDDDDFEYLSQFKWCFSGSGYAIRKLPKYECGGENRWVYMHRVIAKPKEDEVVDHINRNRMDNRRSNLRVLNNQSLNALNKDISKKNKTGAKGVVCLPAGRRKPERYVAYLSVKDKTKYLGTFLTIPEAEKAREEASLLHHGVHYKN